jgi:hypothetical protein
MGVSSTNFYNSIDEWIEACAFHEHMLIPCDNTQLMHVGYICMTCGEGFSIQLTRLKAGLSKHSLSKDLRTAESRARLPFKHFMRGCILIKEEWDEIKLGIHRIRVEDKEELKRKAERQAQEDRKLFGKIHEAVENAEAGLAIRIEEEYD